MPDAYLVSIMKKFSAQPSLLAVAFYLILMSLWILAVSYAGKDYWYTGLAPWYGLGLIFLISGSRYKVGSGELIVKNPFERKAIPLSSIEEVKEIHNPLWKRVLTGFPAFSLRVTHDQQSTLLHTNKQDDLQSLLASVNNAG